MGHPTDVRHILASAALVLGLTIVPTAMVAAQPIPVAPATPEPAVTLSSVRVATGPAGPVVIIAADGPLPSPAVGVLEHPNRIYLDLQGLNTRAFTVTGDGDALVRVRVAVHAAVPLVTRLVLDLNRPVAHALDVSRRLAGVIEVSLKPTGARSQPVAISEPPSALPRPGAPAVTKRRSDDVRQYVERVTPLIDRLEALRPILVSIDRRAAVPAEQIETAVAELAVVRDALAPIRPPAAGLATHDLLRSVCRLAATALSLVGKPNEAAVPWQAASAAAGAQILLDQARAGLPKP